MSTPTEVMEQMQGFAGRILEGDADEIGQLDDDDKRDDDDGVDTDDTAANSDADESTETDEETEEGDQEENEELGEVTFDSIAEKFKVKPEELQDTLGMDIDGEFMSIADMAKGTMRHADYTKKTQELSDKMAQVIPYVDIIAQINTDQEFQDYIIQYFQPPEEMAADDLEELMDSDPDKAKQIIASQKAAKKHREKQKAITAKRQEEKARYLREYASQQRAIVNKDIPEYNSSKGKIEKYMVSLGFKPEDVDSIIDARWARIVWDAVSGRQESDKSRTQQDLKLSLADKRKKAPPKGMSNSPSSTPKSTRRHSRKQVNAARDRAMKSGDEKHMLAYFKTAFGNLPDS